MTEEPTRPSTDTTRDNRRFAALEGLRGIACLMVLVYHCGVNLRSPPFALFGFSGVHVFFVLSGFLLFKPYADSLINGRRFPNTRNFYLRRLLRIYPPYLGSLICFVLLRVVTHVHVPRPGNVIEHALLIFNFDPRIDFFSINSVYWSLAVELQYYLLLPLICMAASRVFSGRAAAVACVVWSLVIGIASRFAEVKWLEGYYTGVANADHVRFRSTLSYLDFFAFGMAVAALTADRGGRLAATLRSRFGQGLLAVGGIVIFFVANDWCAIATGGAWQSTGSSAFLTFFPVVLCTGVAILLLGLVTNGAGGPRWIRAGWLCWVGVISYSLYLYHAGVEFFVLKLNLFHSWNFNGMTVGNAAVSIPPAIAVSAVMFYLVERPSLGLVARVREQRQPVSPAVLVEPLAAVESQLPPSLQSVELLGQ